MAAEISSEAVQPSRATIAVHGGVRPKEQPFDVVISPVFSLSQIQFSDLVR
jgi:hypothetical protein